MNASNVNTSYKTLNELRNTKDPIHLEINLKINFLMHAYTNSKNSFAYILPF